VKGKLCCIINPMWNDTGEKLTCHYCGKVVCQECWIKGSHWINPLVMQKVHGFSGTFHIPQVGKRKKYPDCIDPWKARLMEIKNILELED